MKDKRCCSQQSLLKIKFFGYALAPKANGCLKNCELKKRLAEVKFEFKPMGIGSPHFHICHVAKGNPIIGQYQNSKKKWAKTTFCFDGQKKEFVNSFLLYKVFRKAIKKNR